MTAVLRCRSGFQKLRSIMCRPVWAFRTNWWTVAGAKIRCERAHFYRSLEAQERVFKRVLEACSEQGGKILTVHSIRSVGKVLSHIEHLLPSDRGTVVLYWFTGSPSEAKRAVELGCYFSINSQMLTSVVVNSSRTGF